MTRIAIVGGGRMGDALLSGLLEAGSAVKNLVVAEPAAERARYLSDKYSVLVTSVTDAVENASIVIVAVKPADVGAVMEDIAKVVAGAADDSPEQVLVTIAAGVTTGHLEAKLPAGTAVVRAMPNTPVEVRTGATVLARGRFVSDEQLSQVRAVFECVGSVTILPEGQLDAVTAVSGSGPAYFFLLVEALVDAAVAAGLSRGAATGLAAQTMAGSAAMLLRRMERARQGAAGAIPAVEAAQTMDTTPAQLRAEVTSPGGTTAAAVRELECGGLRSAVDLAVRAAQAHSARSKTPSDQS